ncbi:superoxide dismutase [Polychytrium aggregatum]|uniref:superoxide dismutase n=1 Tax=Polychytrium aggregatum TaxID=110093 RepID=UPI0022FEDB7B|nr:superoxide dismutase [Polychytrium aggregatum]KAI9202440.1 superoxide dismutase [Polychytrium aggregatum]
MAPTVFKSEFAVNMTCSSCADSVRSTLSGIDGIDKIDIQLPEKRVMVEGAVPPSTIFRALKATGLATVLRGQGSTGSANIGAAVCIFETFQGAKGWAQFNNKGLARLQQVDEQTCLIDVAVDGLQEGHWTAAVHTLGDISKGIESTGPEFAELGSFEVGPSGRGDLVAETSKLKVWDVIGRSIVLSHQPTSGTRIPLIAGIIARSAGIFENAKRVCSCSGRTLWEETTPF